jgi:hypothetical protein
MMMNSTVLDFLWTADSVHLTFALDISLNWCHNVPDVEYDLLFMWFDEHEIHVNLQNYSINNTVELEINFILKWKNHRW